MAHTTYVTTLYPTPKPLDSELVQRAVNYLIPCGDEEEKEILASFINSRWAEVHAVAITYGLPSVRANLPNSILCQMERKEVIITNKGKLLYTSNFLHVPNEV